MMFCEMGKTDFCKKVMDRPRCSSYQRVKNGFIRGLQIYECKQCFCFELDKEFWCV